MYTVSSTSIYVGIKLLQKQPCKRFLQGMSKEAKAKLLALLSISWSNTPGDVAQHRHAIIEEQMF